ncbi:MAG: hypothetical protein ABIK09_09250 [Pseudomonadota bacterium]
MRVTAEDQPYVVCYVLDEEVIPWTVTAQCDGDGDCSALVSEAFKEEGGNAWCDDGRCSVSDDCPNDPRQRVGFFLGGDAPPPPGDDGLVTGGEVIRHARIQGQKNPYDLRRQVLILFEGPDGAVVRLDYTLPDNWPLPLRVGDAVSLGLEEGVLESGTLHIDGPDGPAHLLQGFRVPGGLPDTLPVSDLASLLPMDCLPFWDHCGSQVPATVTFSDGAAAWTLTPGDVAWIPDPARPETGVEALLVRLGWSMFSEELVLTPACAWAPRVEVSALFLPTDSCPGAVAKAESAQDLVAGQALAEPPAFEVSGWASFSPKQGGAIEAATWTVEEDPFGGGFGRLEVLPLAIPDPLGLGNRRLRAGAVGEYQVGLTVMDRKGRESCITDTVRFRVFPDSEIALRAELVWLPFGLPSADGDDRIELSMRPSGSAAWEDEDRVCSPASPLPKSFEGAQCAAADLPGGRPALATLQALAPSKTYGFALRAPHTNAAPMVNAVGEGRQIFLRLYCNTELLEFTLPEGFSLAPGDLVEVARVAPGCLLEPLL